MSVPRLGPSRQVNGRFVNQDASADRSLADVWRWFRTRQAAAWPRWVENTARPRLPARVGHGQVAVTFVNHATFLLQTAGATIVTDPVFAGRAGPFGIGGPPRVRRPGLALADLPRVDLVLQSHDHYDHMDLAALRALARRDNPLVLTGLGNARHLRGIGLRRVVELDWGAAHVAGATRVTYVPAQHFSARTPFNRNRALWGGFHVDGDGLRVLFCGDSGYAGHFRDIRAVLGAPDLALVPIGAYEPRWFMQVAHMNPEDAVQAHQDLGAAQSVAMHFGCFQLTDEPFDEPVRRLGPALDAAGVPRERFRVLEVPMPRRLPRPPSRSRTQCRIGTMPRAAIVLAGLLAVLAHPRRPRPGASRPIGT